MEVPGNSYYIDTAVNGRGESLVIGIQYLGTGTQSQLWAKRYRPGFGWSATETVSQGTYLIAPKAALNHRGDGLIVWLEWDGLRYNLRSMDFRYATQSWGSQRLVETYDGTLTDGTDTGNVDWQSVSKVFLDDTGVGLVAWAQDEPRLANRDYAIRVYSATFTAQDGWSPRQGLDVPLTSNHEYANSVDLAMNAQGQAIVVWEREYDASGTTRNAAWKTTFAPGLAWSATTRLDNWNGATFGGYVPSAAIDQAGNALATWRQQTNEIWAARYTASTRTWAAPTRRATVSGYTYFTEPALNERGDAVIVWHNNNDALYATRAPAGGAWTTPVKINTAPLVETEDGAYQARVDYAGNMQVTWLSDGATQQDVVMARFAKSTNTWAAPRTLNTASSGNVWTQYLRQDSHGNAWVFWAQERVLGDASITDIKLNRFVTP
jgi:hypothetical protein